MPSLWFGQRALWVADTTGHSLVEVAPCTGARMLTLPLDSARPPSQGAGAVWVADQDGGLVARVSGHRGSAVFEWMLGGRFLVERAQVDEAPDSVAILGTDDDGGHVEHSFDSRGVARCIRDDVYARETGSAGRQPRRKI